MTIVNLRDQLVDYCTTLEIRPPRPINGISTIPAECLADALLPFIQQQITVSIAKGPSCPVYTAESNAEYHARLSAVRTDPSPTEQENLNCRLVPALLFNERGKWQDDVRLDYNRLSQAMWEHWDLWKNAELALLYGADQGTSGVVFQSIPAGWMLVVPEPWGRHSHPIMVIGRSS